MEDHRITTPANHKRPHKRSRRHPGYRRSDQEKRPAAYAAVDLGTNNCRMLVAHPDAGGLRVIDSFSRIVRLGEGLAGNDHLGADAMERTLEALRVCAAKLRRRNVRRVRGVATEACRRAVNGGAFLDKVREETGIVLEPISAREEARLTLAGSAPLLDGDSAHALIFDIGGGSTEIMWIERPNGEARLIDSLSLPWGVVTLAEITDGIIDDGMDGAPTAYREAVVAMDDALAQFCRRHHISKAIEQGQVQMLGTSGTVTTLGALHLGLKRYDRTRIDGLRLDFAGIEAIDRRLAGMDITARAANPCIGPDRADLVNLGCAILRIICRRWPVGSLRIADRGIREGLLLAMMADDGIHQGSTRVEDQGSPAPVAS